MLPPQTKRVSDLIKVHLREDLNVLLTNNLALARCGFGCRFTKPSNQKSKSKREIVNNQIQRN